jgi:hypothetical protein
MQPAYELCEFLAQTMDPWFRNKSEILISIMPCSLEALGPV